MSIADDGMHEGDIREQLSTILASNDFDASQRNRNFLSYVVDELLAGRGDRVKAYNVATSVFGRSPDFDPQVDSIVRIEASRLRRSLKHYYLTSGCDDPIRFVLPKGTYVPTIESAKLPVSAQKQENKLPSKPNQNFGIKGPRIFVSLFEDEGVNLDCRDFAHDFMRNLIVGLTRFAGLCVFGSDTVVNFGSDADREQIREELEADLLLFGSVSVTNDSFSVKAILADAKTGQYLWAETFHKQLRTETLIQARDEIADKVVRTLAQPYGVVYSRVHHMDGPLPKHLQSYEAVNRYYDFCRTYDVRLCDKLIAELERVVVEDPHYSEAHACLSQLYSNAVRFNYDVRAFTSDPLQRALELADDSIEIAPSSNTAHHARGLACWYAGDTAGCIEALETGHRLNPNDTNTMAELGHRYALLADWDQAVPLLEESYARNPGQRGEFRIGLSLYYYSSGQYERALIEARKIGAQAQVYCHVMIAVSAAQLGRTAESYEAVKKILAIDGSYGTRITKDLMQRHVSANLIEQLIEGVRRAGLHVSPRQVSLASVS
ncbi:hypothetical protein [Tateyamaria pelophila]|uniref:hypothetical protein n=1 Tax=Tateyamaria pelophila TaxID=328415 RepID=UPI001CC09BFC|nr:hypothetical protein [Tateyamaria pelophila]